MQRLANLIYIEHSGGGSSLGLFGGGGGVLGGGGVCWGEDVNLINRTVFALNKSPLPL